MDKLLRMQNVSLSFGKKLLLKNLNLDLARGEIVAITGANGVGKTSVLSLIAGHLAPSQGEIVFAHEDMRTVLVADKPALYPDWTVENFLVWNLRMLGLGQDSDLDAVINSCGLEAVLGQKCALLSHGYRQRVALAQALLAKPEILLLDEPGNGLDFEQNLQLRQILRNLRTTAAILMVHHDFHEVCALADRVYDLADAAVVEIVLPRGEFFCCEWESEELATQTDWRDGNFALYFCADKAEKERKLHEIASFEGLVGVYQEYPAQALRIRMHQARSNLQSRSVYD